MGDDRTPEPLWWCAVAGEVSATRACDDTAWEHLLCGWTRPARADRGGRPMRSDLDSILVNVPAEVQELHDEKARLIKRLTEIHAEIEAWGYLHPNNRPARADREEPTS